MTSGVWFCRGRPNPSAPGQLLVAVTMPSIRKQIWRDPLFAQAAFYELVPGEGQTSTRLPGKGGNPFRSDPTRTDPRIPWRKGGTPGSGSRAYGPAGPAAFGMEEQLSLLKRLWEQGLITEDYRAKNSSCWTGCERDDCRREFLTCPSTLRARSRQTGSPSERHLMSHPPHPCPGNGPSRRGDDWSTLFAEVLLAQLDLRPGLTILDIACGHGIPAFYLVEQVGLTGSVLGIDASRGQVANARTLQRGERCPGSGLIV